MFKLNDLTINLKYRDRRPDSYDIKLSKFIYKRRVVTVSREGIGRS